jgi:hypothetical protein
MNEGWGRKSKQGRNDGSYEQKVAVEAVANQEGGGEVLRRLRLLLFLPLPLSNQIARIPDGAPPRRRVGAAGIPLAAAPRAPCATSLLLPRARIQNPKTKKRCLTDATRSDRSEFWIAAVWRETGRGTRSEGGGGEGRMFSDPKKIPWRSVAFACISPFFRLQVAVGWGGIWRRRWWWWCGGVARCHPSIRYRLTPARDSMPHHMGTAHGHPSKNDSAP